MPMGPAGREDPKSDPRRDHPGPRGGPDKDRTGKGGSSNPAGRTSVSQKTVNDVATIIAINSISPNNATLLQLAEQERQLKQLSTVAASENRRADKDYIDGKIREIQAKLRGMGLAE